VLVEANELTHRLEQHSGLPQLARTLTVLSYVAREQGETGLAREAEFQRGRSSNRSGAKLVARGLSDRRFAQEFVISERTAANHVVHYRKAGCHTPANCHMGDRARTTHIRI
jgi:DNA-binding NarL/FixJ family response regulator